MNITGYVKQFGHLTLDESPFNNVDALIMAQMAYLNWEIIAPTMSRIHCRPQRADRVPMAINRKLNEGEFDSKRSEVLFKEMVNSKRYGRMKIQYVCKNDDLEAIKQFFAVTITLPNGITVISFRGTDLTLNGWKEDCAMSFSENIPSQNEATEYVERVLSRKQGGFYLVGHSKGGNLAFYAAMNLKPEYKRRLLAAYSFDGPGFYNAHIFEGRKYNSVKNKLIKFVPTDSVVGILLHSKDNPIVVKSSNIAVFQHDPFSWLVTNNHNFQIMKKRSTTSIVREKAVGKFLSSITDEDRRDLTEAIFILLGRKDQSLVDLLKNIPGAIKHFLGSYMSFDKERKAKLRKNLVKFFSYYSVTLFEYIREKTIENPNILEISSYTSE